MLEMICEASIAQRACTATGIKKHEQVTEDKQSL